MVRPDAGAVDHLQEVGVPAAIGAVGGVVLLSAAVVAVRMYETLPSRRAAV